MLLQAASGSVLGRITGHLSVIHWLNAFAPVQEGRKEGQREILRRQLEKRFGAIPDWADSRLSSFSASELDEIAVRLLDASRLEDLFLGD